MGKQIQPEVVKRLIEETQNRDFYGKITISFEEGNIVSMRTEESFDAAAMEKKYSPRRQLVVVKSETGVKP